MTYAKRREWKTDTRDGLGETDSKNDAGDGGNQCRCEVAGGRPLKGFELRGVRQS
jgi:hypothetical protein